MAYYPIMSVNIQMCEDLLLGYHTIVCIYSSKERLLFVPAQPFVSSDYLRKISPYHINTLFASNKPFNATVDYGTYRTILANQDSWELMRMILVFSFVKPTLIHVLSIYYQ
jgi:hypothetical protein